METIEPLRFELIGRGLEIDSSYTRRFRSRDWDITDDFLFNQAANRWCEEISRVTFQEKYIELLETEMAPAREIIPDLMEYMPPVVSSPSSSSIVLYVGDDTIVLPNPSQEGIVYLVSTNKNKARNLRNRIRDELTETSSLYEKTGIDDIAVYTGRNYTTNEIEMKDKVAEVNTGEPDEFEEEIYDLLKPLSEAFVSNVTVDFEGHPQCPEYDILFSLSPRQILNIEVKDYSGVDDEPSTDEIIINPRSQATLIDADMTYSVVRGVDEEKLLNFKRDAEIRDGISICEKTELVSIVEEYVKSQMIPASLGGHRGRFI